ncbi:MAG: ABC transporter permease [Treponema sp.]|nr:ABC transporter permease [Treponema sp.]
MIEVLAFSCPLLLAAAGALFSEYAGCLALFLDSAITLSGFLTYTFTVFTGSVILGIILSCITVTALSLLFAFIVEKTNAERFIAAIAINLLYGALVSLLSSLIFKTRGVLTSSSFVFKTLPVNIFSVCITVCVITAAILFLTKTQKGIYFRITGTDPQVLLVRGVNPALYRILSWGIAAAAAGIAGSIMTLRISSFVPNLASGKGWLALAAVFMGRKKLWKIVIFVIVFCVVEYAALLMQNYFPALPSSVILALPYIVSLLIVMISK